MEEKSTNRLRIMIVEDDVATARNMETMLEKRGFTITGVATSGLEARELVRKDRADLVLLDINLQGEVCGLELAYHFHQDYGIPAVFITGYSEDTLIDQARQAKPAGFIRKPFTDVELAAVIEAVAERCISRERLQTHLPGLQAVSNHLTQAVIASDLDGQVMMLNHPAELLTAWSREEALGSPIREVAPIEEDPAQTGSSGLRVVSLTRKNGEKIQVEEKSSPIRSNDGEVIGLVSVLETIGDQEEIPVKIDSNERVPPVRSAALEKVATLAKSTSFRSMLSPKARQAVENQQLQKTARTDVQPLFKTASPLIEELGDPLINFNADGVITYANPEALSTFGSRGPLIGTDLRDCFPLADFERNEQDFHRPLIDGKRHKFDFEETEKDLWFEIRLYRTNDGVLALFHDISQRKVDEA
ncbi:MAG: response regulator, partial [Methylococcales bacterium]|nr:response regulator [Methylococcales bacterium]